MSIKDTRERRAWPVYTRPILHPMHGVSANARRQMDRQNTWKSTRLQTLMNERREAAGARSWQRGSIVAANYFLLFLKSHALFSFWCTYVCESHFAKLFFESKHLGRFAVNEADFACCLDRPSKQRREVRFIGVP